MQRISTLTVTLLAAISLSPFASNTAYALCVKAKKATIRSGAGKKHQKIWEVFKYMPFRKMGEKGKWLKIKDFEGEINWVHKSLTTSDFKCAVVKIKEENIRLGPSSKNKIIGKAKKYYSYRVLKFKGKWVNVKDEHGDSYWIHRSALWIN